MVVLGHIEEYEEDNNYYSMVYSHYGSLYMGLQYDY